MGRAVRLTRWETREQKLVSLEKEPDPPHRGTWNLGVENLTRLEQISFGTAPLGAREDLTLKLGTTVLKMKGGLFFLTQSQDACSPCTLDAAYTSTALESSGTAGSQAILTADSLYVSCCRC